MITFIHRFAFLLCFIYIQLANSLIKDKNTSFSGFRTGVGIYLGLLRSVEKNVHVQGRRQSRFFYLLMKTFTDFVVRTRSDNILAQM